MSDSLNPYAAPKAEVATHRAIAEWGSTEYLASRGKRLAAAMLDSVLMFGAMAPVMMYRGVWERALQGQALSTGEVIGFSILGLLLGVAMHGYTLAHRGQTLGKRALGIAIVRMDGSRVSLSRVVGLRWAPIHFLQSLPLIGSILSSVDVAFIWGKRRRCLHDYLAGTQVINFDHPDCPYQRG